MSRASDEAAPRRYAKGLKDDAFRRSHRAFVAQHDKAYVDKHALAAAVDEAWEKCMHRKPADPRVFLANALHPAAEDELLRQLRDDAAAGVAGAQPAIESRLLLPTAAEAAAVNAAFAALVREPAAEDRVYHAVARAARSAAVADRLKAFDRDCGDRLCSLLPLFRGLCAHLDRPAVAGEIARVAVRRHVRAGILERDYTAFCGGLLAVADEAAAAERRAAGGRVEAAWMRVHTLVAVSMTIGGKGLDPAAAADGCLDLQDGDADTVRATLRDLAASNNREAAAAVAARGVVDLSPAAAEVLRRHGISPTAFGLKMLDGVELVVDLVQSRGAGSAAKYLHVLGDRHASLGVTPNLYPVVGQALLSSLHHGLAAQASQQAAARSRAWRKALCTALYFLRKAANPPPPWVPGEGSDPPPARSEPASPHIASAPVPTPPPPRRRASQILRQDAVPPGASYANSDISNVPVTDEQLRRVFDEVVPPGKAGIPLDAMVRTVLEQDSLGVPVSKERVRRQIAEVLAKHGRNDIDFALFSVIMLRLSQR
ncbi:hypothetical protein DIPPA_14496 [Diplonema papillatum]|nr:hypothetical protein DIPPA_14496 [Diplonema papillatum]|eukprot:gene9433-14626_t